MRCRACDHSNAPGRLYCAECGGSLGHFVGRDQEVEALRGALEDSLSGRARLVLLAGEPGIGKTRTAEELAAHARRRGAEILWGRCQENEGTPGFWPWVQIIRTQLQGRSVEALASVTGANAPEIAQLVGEPRQRLPDLSPALPIERARFRLFESIAAWLRAAGVRQPLVLILDDLHCADKPSLLLLQFIARELTQARLLVVGTYRDTEVRRRHPLSDALSELAHSPLTRRIALRGLSEQDVALLIALISGEDPSAPLAAAVWRQTEGNPFFVNELVRLLVAEGGLGRGGGAPWELAVPQGVRDLIGRRLDGLSPCCNAVLSVASVIGREFEGRDLEALGEFPSEQLLDALEEALEARIILDLPRTPGRYGFAHSLIREALYDELPAIRRVHLHGRIGEALEHVLGAMLEPRLAELAYHFCEASRGGADVDKAIDYATRAGARASELLAHEDAAAHYERALEALQLREPDDGVARCDLLLARGEAETRSGDTARARTTFFEAADIARRLALPERLARAALGVGAGFGGFLGYGAGVVDEALVSLIEESLGALGTEDSAPRALLLGRLAVALYWSPAPERRASLGPMTGQAVAMAERLGDTTVQLVSLASRHWANWRPDNVRNRLALATDMVELATRVGEREAIVLGRAYRIVDLLELGDVGAADPEIEALARVAEELREPRYLSCAYLFRVTRATMSGRFAESERLIHQALAVGQRADSRTARDLFFAHMWTVRTHQGRLAELVQALEGFVKQHALTPGRRAGLAHSYVALGRQADAWKEFEHIAAGDFADLPHDANWLITISVLAEVCAALGDARRAGLLYELLSPYAERNVVGTYAIVCNGSASRYLGLLAALVGRRDEAARHFGDAVAMNARMGARTFVALTQHDQAAMLLARDGPGDRQRGRRLLAAAADTARELGMAALLARASTLQAAHGGPQREDRAEPAIPAAPEATAERNAFTRAGDYWTLSYDGTVVHLKDAKGLRYIARLLRCPGQELHARELVSEGGEDLPSLRLGSTGPILDPEARAQYKRRLADLREDLEEAERFNDAGRAHRARAEIDVITRELAAATGVGGRAREAGSGAERARLMVTKRIKDSLQAIRSAHPALGEHLAAHVRTGYFCSYGLDPERAIVWVVSA